MPAVVIWCTWWYTHYGDKIEIKRQIMCQLWREGVPVGSRTRDRVEAGPALVTNTMSHQGKTYARAARDGVGNVRKNRSLLHLTSKE
jgi:hypothetical protein